MLNRWSPLDETHQLRLSFACNSFISGFRQLFLLLQPSWLSLVLVGSFLWVVGLGGVGRYFQSRVFQEKESWRHPSEYSLPKFGPFNLGGNSDRYCGIHCTYWTGPPGEVGFMWSDGQQRATMATENGLFVQIRPCINTTASFCCCKGNDVDQLFQNCCAFKYSPAIKVCTKSPQKIHAGETNAPGLLHKEEVCCLAECWKLIHGPLRLLAAQAWKDVEPLDVSDYHYAPCSTLVLAINFVACLLVMETVMRVSSHLRQKLL